MAFTARGGGGGDRRGKYSFRGHFRRVLETKGLRHIVVSMLGTLAVASVAFAYCSSDHITGPTRSIGNSPTSSSPSAWSDGDDGIVPIDPGIITIPIDIGPPTAIETSFGPIFLPIDMQATPCNHDVVLWDPKRTYVKMSGFMSLNPLTGVVHIRGHFEENAQGVGTLVIPTRRYTGHEVYDQAFDIVPPRTSDDEEFLLKIIAKGNIEPWPLYPNDDFVMYVRVRTVMYAGILRAESVTAYTKCY